MDSNETETVDVVTVIGNNMIDSVNNNNTDDININEKVLSEEFFEKKDIRSKAFIGAPITMLATGFTEAIVLTVCFIYLQLSIFNT